MLNLTVILFSPIILAISIGSVNLLV